MKGLLFGINNEDISKSSCHIEKNSKKKYTDSMLVSSRHISSLTSKNKRDFRTSVLSFPRGLILL